MKAFGFWQAWLVWYPFYRHWKTPKQDDSFGFWIILSGRWRFLEDRKNDIYLGAHSNIGIDISELGTRKNFLCISRLCDLVSSLKEVLEILAPQSKTQMKINLLQVEAVMKNRLARIPAVLNCGRSQCVGIEAEDDNSENCSTNFLQMQKNQPIDLWEHFERYYKKLPVLGFNSARYDIKLVIC